MPDFFFKPGDIADSVCIRLHDGFHKRFRIPVDRKEGQVVFLHGGSKTRKSGNRDLVAAPGQFLTQNNKRADIPC